MVRPGGKSTRDDRSRLAPPAASRKSKRRLAQALALGVLGLPVVLWLPPRLCVTTTDSLRSRVFFLRDRGIAGEIGRGDYVRFERVHPWAGTSEPVSLLKEVGCGPGDELRVYATGDVYCNGDYLGWALAEDSEGNPLPLFRFDGVIPEGKLFVVGHHPRSWDSRYFGFVDVEEVLNRAYPLF
ncbi:MAG: S26 family signal peptidase [Thermodesulfobacteriota bacterium]